MTASKMLYNNDYTIPLLFQQRKHLLIISVKNKHFISPHAFIAIKQITEFVKKTRKLKNYTQKSNTIFHWDKSLKLKIMALKSSLRKGKKRYSNATSLYHGREIPTLWDNLTANNSRGITFWFKPECGYV